MRQATKKLTFVVSVVACCAFLIIAIFVISRFLGPTPIDRGSLPPITIFSSCEDAKYARRDEKRKNAVKFLYESGGEEAIRDCLIDKQLPRGTLVLLCKDALSEYDYSSTEILQIVLGLDREAVLLTCKTQYTQ